MTSSAQVASNRQNSLLSTGPRTEAGKLASSKNAICHGLSAADPVLSYESRDQFTLLVKSCTTEFQPDSHHEHYLISLVAAARWRLDRVQRIENAAMDLIVLGAEDETCGSPDHKLAQRMLDAGGDPIPRLERYRASIERSLHRAVKEFKMAEKYRLQNEADKARAEAYLREQTIHAIMNAPIPGYEPGFIHRMMEEKRRQAAANQSGS